MSETPESTSKALVPTGPRELALTPDEAKKSFAEREKKVNRTSTTILVGSMITSLALLHPLGGAAFGVYWSSFAFEKYRTRSKLKKIETDKAAYNKAQKDKADRIAREREERIARIKSAVYESSITRTIKQDGLRAFQEFLFTLAGEVPMILHITDVRTEYDDRRTMARELTSGTIYEAIQDPHLSKPRWGDKLTDIEWTFHFSKQEMVLRLIKGLQGQAALATSGSDAALEQAPDKAVSILPPPPNRPAKGFEPPPPGASPV